MTATMSQPSPCKTPEGFLPCPSWCSGNCHGTSDYPYHKSDWRVWRGHDTPTFYFQIMRHDEKDLHGGPTTMGQIDFNVHVDVEGSNVLDWDGAMGCSEMRWFAEFLLALANEVDPHNLNGEPLEWHTPHRKPLLGSGEPLPIVSNAAPVPRQHRARQLYSGVEYFAGAGYFREPSGDPNGF